VGVSVSLTVGVALAVVPGAGHSATKCFSHIYIDMKVAILIYVLNLLILALSKYLYECISMSTN